MAADGTPEQAIRRCGVAIARLRTARGWPRAKLIARLYDQIDPTDPAYERISIAWLARLEQGRVVKLSRAALEALCRALECTPQERLLLLLLADRNVLYCADQPPTAVAQALAYVMCQLYHEANQLLAELVGARSLHELGDLELLEIVDLALAHVQTQQGGAYGTTKADARPVCPAAR